MNCQPLPSFAHRRANKSLSHSQLVAKMVSPRRLFLFTSANNANICNHGSTHLAKGFPVCREISCFPLASCFPLGPRKSHDDCQFPEWESALFSTWMRNKRSNHMHEAQLARRQLSKDDRIIEQAIERILRDIEGYTLFP